jgi:NADPH:quinone reductase-like Zn-dependent oxidoreductase
MSRRVVIAHPGGPDALELVREEAPSPGRGQVRIHVEAAGVAFGDVMRRRGVLAPRKKPFTPGYDVAGTIDELGPGVAGYRVGDRVAVMMPRVGIGGYAEHVCVAEKRLVRVPDGVSADDAVCLGLNYITAYQLLHRFVKVKEGQRILVHGAAGGVGTALLDLGKLAGLEMYGTASAPKHDLVRERGCTPIDYRSEDFVARIDELTGGRGVEVVYDGIGGRHLRSSYQTLARGGTLVSFGVSGDLERGLRGLARGMMTFAALKLRPFDGRAVRMYLISISRGAGWRPCRDDWSTLLGLRAEGKLSPIVGARVPIEEAPRAHDMLDRAAVVGKIVLTV